MEIFFVLLADICQESIYCFFNLHRDIIIVITGMIKTRRKFIKLFVLQVLTFNHIND